MLERGGIFEAVPRHDAVVGVRGRHEHRRIGSPVLDIVIGRIGEQILEIGFLRRIAIIVDPIAASGEARSEEHTSEPQSLMRTSYAVFCLKTNNTTRMTIHT